MKEAAPPKHYAFTTSSRKTSWQAYGTSSWFTDYSDTTVLHQPILFSDHAAIILSDIHDSELVKRPYRIENWSKKAVAATIAAAAPRDEAEPSISAAGPREEVAEEGEDSEDKRLLATSFRKWRNKIYRLKDLAGVWHHDFDHIASLSLEFYKDLYSVSDSATSRSSDWWESLQLPSVLSTQQGLDLSEFFGAGLKLLGLILYEVSPWSFGEFYFLLLTGFPHVFL
uniref:Uncharacterized protein n=1 Tax=Chenopodium quinoa TaxID=63459 RepID=A0A803MDD5_CHEQI